MEKEKQGFHSWAWLVIVLLGGLLMIFGGLQDALLFFMPEMEIVPGWYTALPEVGLICGLIVLTSAVLNILWGWELKDAVGDQERMLASRIVLVNSIAMIADWISGYYGFGSFVAFLIGIWLIKKQPLAK